MRTEEALQPEPRPKSQSRNGLAKTLDALLHLQHWQLYCGQLPLVPLSALPQTRGVAVFVRRGFHVLLLASLVPYLLSGLGHLMAQPRGPLPRLGRQTSGVFSFYIQG